MNKIKQLKKVKIDEHIKNSKKSEEKSNVGKRGRPKGSVKKKDEIKIESINVGGGLDRAGEGPDLQGAGVNIGDGIESNVIPVYDTTEQAKAFIKTPFEVSAMIFSEPRLTLYPEELDAIMPSWKVVFDKHIVPNLGENADVYLFATVMLGITAKKYSIIASKPKDKFVSEMKVEPVQEKNQSSQQNMASPIPVMPVFGGNA